MVNFSVCLPSWTSGFFIFIFSVTNIIPGKENALNLIFSDSLEWVNGKCLTIWKKDLDQLAFWGQKWGPCDFVSLSVIVTQWKWHVLNFSNLLIWVIWQRAEMSYTLKDWAMNVLWRTRDLFCRRWTPSTIWPRVTLTAGPRITPTAGPEALAPLVWP